eukprot:g27106.t1
MAWTSGADDELLHGSTSYLSMLHDKGRNAAYDAALRAVGRAPELVLDLGAGTGLLAALACQAHPSCRAVACEVYERCAHVAGLVLKENGLQERVKVVNKVASDLEVGEDLPQKADLCIFELFDSQLLGARAGGDAKRTTRRPTTLERPLWCLALSVVSTASALPALAELEPGTFHLLQPPQEDGTGCGLGKPYEFLVKTPENQINSKELVLEFFGGGGCWSYETCNATTEGWLGGERTKYWLSETGLEFIRSMMGSSVKNCRFPGFNVGGLWDFCNEEHPHRSPHLCPSSRNWTWVTLAYCTGDQHMGNHVARYDDSNGSYMEVQHLGARNADSVLRWVQRSFPELERIHVVGESAGGWATFAWTQEARRGAAAVAGFSDSALHLLCPSDVCTAVLPSVDDTWNATNDFITPSWSVLWTAEAIRRSNWSLVDLMVEALNHFAGRMTFGIFTRSADADQLLYWSLFGGELGTWTTRMVALVNNMERRLPPTLLRSYLESILPILRDAQARLLRSDCVFIPRKVKVKAVLVSCPALLAADVPELRGAAWPLMLGQLGLGEGRWAGWCKGPQWWRSTRRGMVVGVGPRWCVAQQLDGGSDEVPLTSFFPGDLQLLILELADEMGIFEVCGQAERLEAVLQQPANPRLVDPYGRCPLHLAAGDGEVRCLRLLLEAQASVHQKTSTGATVLHFGAQNGCIEALQLLLELGGEVEKGSNTGLMPLHLGALHGHVEVLRLLLDHKASQERSTSDTGERALHLAARQGHTEVVQLLLEQSARTSDAAQRHDAANATTLRGETPLHLAARFGHLEIVRVLLHYGAAKMPMCEHGTPLHLAVQGNHLELVSFLLDADVDLELSTAHPASTPLHIACCAGYVDLVELLLARQAQADRGGGAEGRGATPLQMATHNGHAAVMMFLLEEPRADWDGLAAGASAMKTTLDSPDPPMHLAARVGHLEPVRLLLHARADLEAVGSSNCTALQSAVRGGHTPVVAELLAAGAAVSARDDKGHSALHEAAQRGNDLAHLLLLHGAPVDALTTDSLTPLHLAAWKNHVALVRLLLEAKASVNRSTPDGPVPLLMAAYVGNVEVVQLLLEFGAEDQLSAEGFSALHRAAQKGHLEVVRLLLSKVMRLLLELGADKEKGSQHGDTPLHLCARGGAECLDSVRFLLEHRAPVDSKSHLRATPLHLAVRSGSVDLVQVLIDAGAAKDVERHVEVAGLLLALKAEMTKATRDLSDNLLTTPLHKAAQMGDREMLQLLLDHGCPVDECADELTPLHMATMNGHAAVAQRLIDEEAEINKASQIGMTPLHMAAREQHSELLRLLLRRPDCAIDAVDRRGQSALHLAAELGHVEMVRALLEAGAQKEPDDGFGTKRPLTVAHPCNSPAAIRTWCSSCCRLAATAADASQAARHHWRPCLSFLPGRAVEGWSEVSITAAFDEEGVWFAWGEGCPPRWLEGVTHIPPERERLLLAAPGGAFRRGLRALAELASWSPAPVLLLPAEDRPQPQGFEGSKASKYLPHRGPGTVLKGQTERRPATGGTVEDLLCLDTFAQVLEADVPVRPKALARLRGSDRWPPGFNAVDPSQVAGSAATVLIEPFVGEAARPWVLALELARRLNKHLCPSPSARVLPAGVTIMATLVECAGGPGGALAIGHAASMELVSENFDDAIQSAQKNLGTPYVEDGANAFVLFCSDFCPWCKNYLNATWTSLMQKHKGSKEVLVAHIDCGSPAYEMGELRSPGTVTSACKRYGVDPICDKEEGHIPTIKYYDVSEEKWRRYKKGWEEDTLEGFIGDRLRPACNVKTAEHCDDKEFAC